jgi:hypothetical protein
MIKEVDGGLLVYLGHRLGKGESGQVFVGRLEGQPCAVKMIEL